MRTLIVDGVNYRLFTPSSEDEIESFIVIHSKQIFGEDSLYFSVKKQLKSLNKQR